LPAGPDVFENQHYEAPGISLAQILAILRARKRTAILLVVSFLALVLIVAKLMPKNYEATATLLVNYQVNQGGTEIPGFLLGTYMATQVELMRSPEVLQPVVDELNLTHDPEFTSGFRGGDEGALRIFTETTLFKHLAIDQGRGSQLLYITASSRNPVMAAKIANAVANVYAANERKRLKDPADDRAREYAQQLADLQAQVMAAQQKVTDLRQKTGTSPVSNANSGASDADTQTLISLEQQLLQAKNMRRAAESATNLAPIGSNGSGGASPEIEELNKEIVAKQLQLSQLAATYGSRHPKVLALQSELDQARRSVKIEEEKYLSDTRELEAKLQRAVDTQQQKILAVRKVQDEGAKLELELESRQSEYKRALDAYDQIVFASAGKSTNISFVSGAAVPVEPSKSSKGKFLIAGSFIAILLGIGAPIFYELLFDRRLYCREDFERQFQLPVLAEFGPAPLLPTPK
jgi:uncharacterized protein involved in exopolysaccharide biosynthesis